MQPNNDLSRSPRRTRVRFAPSPTGPLHMGGVRTALYNYLYAKQAGGDFILRIEDTDSQRFVPGAEQYIIDSLRWCGIYPDEGVDARGNVVETPSEKHPHAPYRQSQRKPLYRQYAEQLIRSGHAYYAFDTPQELDARRKEAEAAKSTFIYNHITRRELKNSLTLPAAEVDRLLATTRTWTIRFKTPENEIVEMDDLIRGHIEVNSGTLDDKVLWKAADELPTYHLANIVDDHLMEITEVIRGEEWLPSLPLHYLLYRAFGWEETRPRFAHLSLLLKPDGKGKLSKRDGDRLGFPVFPLRWVNPQGEVSRGYREDGYYPEAFINMLALLGWNPGTEQELFTLPELTAAFSLERVIKSGARFNPEKARWFNQEYLRKQTDAQLAAQFIPLLEEDGIAVTPDTAFSHPQTGADGKIAVTAGYVQAVCGLIRERAHFVADFREIAHYLFTAPDSYDPADVKKFWSPETRAIIARVLDLLAGLPAEASEEQIEHALTDFIRANEWKMGTVMNTLRLFFVGRAKGLGIAQIIRFIGQEETLRRIRRAVEALPL